MKRYFGAIKCIFDVTAQNEADLYDYIEKQVEADGITIKVINIEDEETISRDEWMADTINDERKIIKGV